MPEFRSFDRADVARMSFTPRLVHRAGIFVIRRAYAESTSTAVRGRADSWAEYEPRLDAAGLAEFLGTSIDAVNQAIADSAVRYLVTADGFALIPASQFPSSDNSLVPLLGEVATLINPCRSDPAGPSVGGLAPQKEQAGRTPVEVLRSSEPRRSPE